MKKTLSCCGTRREKAKTSRKVLNISSIRLSLFHGLCLVFHTFRTILLFLFSTQMSWNSIALHFNHCIYSSCDDLSICVQKGFIIDDEIDNPHYFGETNFISFENHARLPMCTSVLRPNTKRHPSKEERSAYWLSQYGIGRRKKFTRWPGATKPPVVTMGSGHASTSTSFSLVSYLYETFVPDDIFSDLL